jgi:hypothetical protein
MSDEALVVVPLPLDAGGVTFAVARLVAEGEQPFAEAIVAIPGTPSPRRSGFRCRAMVSRGSGQAPRAGRTSITTKA